ncbi:hypothetical protein [Streptomyces werraensis]|uniref:hypothetical protein n=1 Tax=Streptomyces werraensis TaxID=68284 RepID=UPI0033B6DDE3
MAARPVRAARRGSRRGTLRPARTLLALLLTVLAASATVCGLATSAHASSMTSAGPLAMASAMRHEGDDGCDQAAGSMTVSPGSDCDRTHCAQASGRPYLSCCDTPSPNGVHSTTPVIAIPPQPGVVPGQPPAAHQSRCADPADSGPGPPDLHMLQLLRV